MNSIGRILNLLRKEIPSPGTDYTGTVTKVEGGVAYVQLAGADINDTPVKMSVNAKKGDTVRVRVNKGKAWLMGNDTAPPTDDTYAKESEVILSNELKKTNVTVKTVEDTAAEARKIAGNTDQYFWHVTSGTDTGAHLTEKPQKEFLEDPENGGGNLLARSNGIAVRDGLTELAQFGATVILGDNTSTHVEIDSDSIELYNSNPTRCLTINASESQVTVPVIVSDNESDIFYTSNDTPTTLNVSGTWSNMPTDSATFELLRVRIEYQIVYVFTLNGNPYYDTIDGGRWLTITNGSGQYSFTGKFNRLDRGIKKHTLTIGYDAVTKEITVSMTDATSITMHGSAYETNITSPAPAMLFGSLAPNGTIGGYSAVLGGNLNSAGNYQTVIGKWNSSSSNHVLEIGNGTSESARSNAVAVDWNGNAIIAGDIVSSSGDISQAFISAYSPFQLLYCHARRFGGMIHFSMEFFINGTFVANYRYTVGTIASDYVPRTIEAGTGHSTDSGYNPVGSVTWIANTNGDLQISLQSTAGAYVFLQGFYPYR